jgi:predicted GIY-YIG superfamily endonuclease
MSDAQHTGPVYISIVRGTRDHLHIATAVNREEKLEAINSGNGPVSLRSYIPVELVSVRRFSNYTEARPVVKKLKGYTRERKERLIAAFLREWNASSEKTIEQACLLSERIGYPPSKA